MSSEASFAQTSEAPADHCPDPPKPVDSQTANAPTDWDGLSSQFLEEPLADVSSDQAEFPQQADCVAEARGDASVVPLDYDMLREDPSLFQLERTDNSPAQTQSRGAMHPLPEVVILEQKDPAHSITARLLLIDWTTVILSSLLLACIGFIGLKLFYLICGILYKRRSCKILANLVFEHGDYPGYITVLSRRGFRFRLVNSFQAEALGALLAERNILHFDVVIKDRVLPVVLDPVEDGVVLVFFLFKLSTDQWRDILSLSLKRPVFSMHQPVPDNEEFRNYIMAARREKIAKSLLKEPDVMNQPL